MQNWPTRVSALFNHLKPVRSHLVGHTEEHRGLTERRLAVIDCARLGHGGERTDPSWHLAAPWPPLWSGPLALWAEASVSNDRLLPLDQSIQRSGRRDLVQVLRWDERLPVLLLRDGKHRHNDVVTLTWELTPLSCLAALELTLAGGRRARAGFWWGALGMRNPRGFSWVRRPGKQAEARPREAGASQVAGGVETPLPLGGLWKREGGVAHGRVEERAVVGRSVEVNIREHPPAVLPSAFSYQTRWSLEWYKMQTFRLFTEEKQHSRSIQVFQLAMLVSRHAPQV